MESLCLLSAIKLISFSNQIGHCHPHFLFHIDFHFLRITATTKKTASQRCHNQRNVVRSNDETPIHLELVVLLVANRC